MPAVFFDNVPAAPGAVAVALDNAAGIALLVDHLAAVHGQRRIAYVGPPETVGSGGSGAEGVGRGAARGVPGRDRARRPARSRPSTCGSPATRTEEQVAGR